MHYDSKYSKAQPDSGHKGYDYCASKAQLYSGYKSDYSKHSKSRQDSVDSKEKTSSSKTNLIKIFDIAF